MKRLSALATGALLLASCDAAAPAVQAQVRHSFIQQCQQLAEGNGLAPALVQPVCECGADEFVKGGVDLSDVSAARVQEIVNTCAQRIGPQAGGRAMENIGG